MINRLTRLSLQCLAVALFFVALRAEAEPYLAVQTGLKCGQCHVNPTGGGLRTQYGDVFAQTLLPQQKLDTGSPDLWTGDITKFLRVGGDLRYDFEDTVVPETRAHNVFDLQQMRVYLEANVVPDRLIVYVDESVAPNGALNREAYGLFWSKDHDWYLKAGQMYLPFGLRLQDQTALILNASGINMTSPDQGLEFGWEHGHWDAQVAISNGTPGIVSGQNGKQYTGNLVWVESGFRVGAAATMNYKIEGNKSVLALFGGVRTGPIEWLAQVESVDDKSIVEDRLVEGQRQLAGLFEANWLIAKGNNLKLTEELFDADRNVGDDNETRFSVVYEWTPIQFAQIRGGMRWMDGIPDINTQHTKFYFVELHGFL